jgi:hypothetical protein
MRPSGILVGFVLGALLLAPARAAGRSGGEAPADLREQGWGAPDESGGAGPTGTLAVPEIGGPGRVTTAGRLWMKSTNIGHMGNPFPALSSDPGAQWPGSSGVEYLYNWSLWVGARRSTAGPGTERYRVSAGIEWRPPSLDPEDRIYRAYEGEIGGLREIDDDGDGRWDEEWLNGRDDDGDGRIDEDFAAISEAMDAFDMRDDTPQATGYNGGEAHLPLGLHVHQRTLSFASGVAADLVGVEYVIRNDSNQPLDSVYVGFHVDQYVGSRTRSGYWLDDVPEPRIPQQDVSLPMDVLDARYDPRTDFGHPAGFCTRDQVSVRGFTMIDDDGDQGATPGASTFLLLDHSTDLRGLAAPRRVGFRAFHILRPAAPFGQGGLPVRVIVRYALLSTRDGVSGSCAITTGPREDCRAVE